MYIFPQNEVLQNRIWSSNALHLPICAHRHNSAMNGNRSWNRCAPRSARLRQQIDIYTFNGSGSTYSVTKREMCQRVCQQQKDRQSLSSQSSRPPPDLWLGAYESKWSELCGSVANSHKILGEKCCNSNAPSPTYIYILIIIDYYWASNLSLITCTWSCMHRAFL